MRAQRFVSLVRRYTSFDELTAEEEAKAQKALAARNREREQNKLRMCQVREAQRVAKEVGKVSSPAG